MKINLTVKVEDMMNYVGCDYIVTLKGLNLHWPKLIQRIKEEFGPENRQVASEDYTSHIRMHGRGDERG